MYGLLNGLGLSPKHGYYILRDEASTLIPYSYYCYYFTVFYSVLYHSLALTICISYALYLSVYNTPFNVVSPTTSHSSPTESKDQRPCKPVIPSGP